MVSSRARGHFSGEDGELFLASAHVLNSSRRGDKQGEEIHRLGQIEEIQVPICHWIRLHSYLYSYPL